MVGTPAEDVRPGRAVRVTKNTPDLIADLGVIFGVESEDAVDLLNRFAEYGWTIVRTDELERLEELSAAPDAHEDGETLGCLLLLVFLVTTVFVLLVLRPFG